MSNPWDRPAEVSTGNPWDRPEEVAPPAEPDFWDEVGLAFDMQASDVQNLGNIRRAYLPTGGLTMGVDNPEDPSYNQTATVSYESAEEYYGKEFMDAEPRERINMLEAWRTQGAKEEYADVIQYQEEYGADELARFVGGAGGALASPTTMIPVGKTLPAVMTLSAALGFSAEGLQQMVDGAFNPTKLATTTAMAGLGGPILNELGLKGVDASKYVGRQMQKILSVQPFDTDEAVAISRNLGDAYAMRVAGGMENDAIIMDDARRELGISALDFFRVARAGVDMPKVPSLPEARKLMASKEQSMASVSAAARYTDDLVAPISTVISNIDGRIGGRLREHDMQVSVKLAEKEDKVKGFASAMSRLGKGKDKVPYKGKMVTRQEVAQTFERALFNGNFDQADSLAKTYFPEIVPSWTQTRGVLDDLYNDLVSVGRKADFQQNYFPRAVKDFRGLRDAVGDKWGPIQDELKKTAAKVLGKGKPWQALDDKTKSDVVNRYLTPYAATPDGFSNLKDRTVTDVTEDLSKYYYSAPESLMMYVNKSVRDIEKRKFFGKGAHMNEAGLFDLDASLGNLAQQGLSDKTLTAGQAADLGMLLRTRFVEGERAAGKVMTFAKDLQHISLLAQLPAAMTQLGDIGASIYSHGVVNTASGFLSSLKGAGGRQVSVEDLGLGRQISAEVGTISGVADILDKAFTYSGFKGVDRLGKTTFLNASLRKNAQIAARKPDVLRKKWTKVFGTETEGVIADFQKAQKAMKAGEKVELTDNVKLLMWNELADVQPIALSEMPASYLNSPNGRIFYALKSFALKQIDIMRRDILQEARRGNHATALRNMTAYGMSIGLAGGTMQMARDMVMKGETDPEDFPDKVFETWASLFFLNKYTRDKHIGEGNIGAALVNTLMPATPDIVDSTIGEGIRYLAEGDADFDTGKVTSALPVFGQMMYLWTMGGAEKRMEREQEAKDDKRKERLGLSGRN
jgi:hypothetical protein